MNKKILLVLLPFALIGCKGNPVVGTWTANGPMGSVSVTFKADKTFQESLPGLSSGAIMSGTYEVKDKEVDMKLTNMGGTAVPTAGQESQPATLSGDGKTLTVAGVSLTKQ